MGSERSEAKGSGSGDVGAVAGIRGSGAETGRPVVNGSGAFAAGMGAETGRPAINSSGTGAEGIFAGLGDVRRVHMSGIGGASMSGLSELLISLGYAVTGYDREESARVLRLAALGALVNVHEAGGDIELGGRPDVVVYTAAMPHDSPELLRARELEVPAITRSELLGRVLRGFDVSIAVAGTHGKTTTTAMLAEILQAASLDPTVLIGAEYGPIGGNTLIGKARGVAAAEACEYTDSFLRLHPTIAAITNIELDHTDYFRDLEHMKSSFAQFASQTSLRVIANAGDSNAISLYASLDADERAKWAFFRIANDPSDASGTDGEAEGYPKRTAEETKPCARSAPEATGYSKSAPEATSCARSAPEATKPFAGLPICAEASIAGVDPAGFIEFDLRLGSPQTCGAAGPAECDACLGAPARVRLPALGLYNVENALAAAASAFFAGASAEDAARGLRHFAGAKKRFERLGTARGMDLYDDYAHHPSAARLALAALRDLARARPGAEVWCVFQPHTYSRTKAFFYEFAHAFKDADHVALADIYAAREPDPGDVSSALLAQAMRAAGTDACHFSGGFGDIAAHILKNGKPGDIVVTMGAGLASKTADIMLGQEPV